VGERRAQPGAAVEATTPTRRWFLQYRPELALGFEVEERVSMDRRLSYATR